MGAEYVVGWQDYRSGSNWDVYLQRVDAAGSLDGEEVLVSAAPVDDYAQDQPAVAYGTAEETHLVVWTDDRDGTDDVYGQFVAGGGALVGEAFVIAQASGYWEQTPAVAYNAATGYFLVTWPDAREGDAADVYARAVAGGSGTLGDEFLVYAGEEYQYTPAVAANEVAGDYLVVWQETDVGDIYGQRTLTESTAGETFTITVADGNQESPAVAYDPEENAYLVVWAHANGSDDDVRGRIVGADGGLQGTELTIASGTAEQQYPAVAANGAGGYVVAWQEGATSSDIAAAVVDGTGQVLGGGAETLAAAANTQERPALSYDTARGRYLAVWADYRNAAEGPDVYGQLYRDYTVVVEYRYDSLHRLVRADYSSGVHFAYGYDETGNRTMLTEATPLSGTIVTTYTYDLADRLITVTRAGVATAYTWNDRGDLLDDGTQEYTWDAAGRLVGVSVTDGPGVAYLYDGLNDRTAMIVAGVTTTYVVDPFGLVDHVSQVLAEETDGVTTRNFYGLDLLAQARSTMTTYLDYDALSVRLRLDEDGAVATAYRYGPFGEAMGASPTGYGFAGEQRDAPVGLVYLRARYYAPEMGRFVSRDPLAGLPDYPQLANPYVYVVNRPIVLADPSGMCIPPLMSLMDLLRLAAHIPELVDLDEVTPVHIKGRWDWVSAINVSVPWLCLTPDDVYHWREEAGEFIYLESALNTIVQGLGRITRGNGDAVLRTLTCKGGVCRWQVYRSQSFLNGQRGGQTSMGRWWGGDGLVPISGLSADTIFYGMPYWGVDYINTQDMTIHEFGHVGDYFSSYIAGKSWSSELPDIVGEDNSPRGKAERVAEGFRVTIKGFSSDSDAKYVARKIKEMWRYWGDDWPHR